MKKILFLAVLVLLVSFYGVTTSDLRSAAQCGKKWKVVFEDNFDSFDGSKWITMHDNGNRTIWSNKELQFYKDNNVTVENGICKLIVKEESYYGKDVESEKQFQYTSGMICSSKGFMQQYGKWEMKVRFPFNRGCWPAFYLVPLKRPTLPEIDIFEYFGKEKNKISCTQHWGTDYLNPQKDNTKDPYYFMKSKELTGDYANKWMTWTFESYPNKMVWKLNGKTVFKATEGIPDSPLYMIANVAVKDWDGKPVDNSGFPYVMEIDYIKAYQLE
ncbi:MAG TPA: glycoside hydrolase family 16 protein [Ignavibacteria bacterium]|nr:glycoside hydrolase family 16 protein [Ignavibacteria bacterium]